MTTPTQARPASCAATQNDRHGALFCCPLKYGHFGRHDWQRVTAAPAKAQEPDDERSESARGDALVQALRKGTKLDKEAADRIELLERQPNLLPALAESQAARDESVALLRECQPWMCDDPDDVTDTKLRARIDAFLATVGK